MASVVPKKTYRSKAKQKAECQKPPQYRGHTIDYIACTEYHEARQKAGDRQLFCEVCQRWNYRDELCSFAKTVPAGICISCKSRRYAKGEMLCSQCISELEAARATAPTERIEP
jgi:hypothetical protein